MPDVARAASRLCEARVIPVLRAQRADDALAAARRLVEVGATAIELTTTTPGWLTVLQTLREAVPDVLLGMGTVTSAAAADEALGAGAAFLVSPGLAPEARDVAEQAGALFVEGALTPTEMNEAVARSATGLVKLFPAHVGGPAYLRSLTTVLPEARVIPTGGVALDRVGDWFAAGAVAVGVGSDLTAAGDLRARWTAALASGTG